MIEKAGASVQEAGLLKTRDSGGLIRIEANERRGIMRLAEFNWGRGNLRRLIGAKHRNSYGSSTR
jgi:hypothetical protein